MIALVWLLACGGGAPEVTAPEASPVDQPVKVAAVPEAAPAPAPWPGVALAIPERHTTSPLAQPGDDGVAHVRAVLLATVTDHARDPKNPWGIAHAMVAMGPVVPLTDGRDGVDVLYQDWGQLLTVGEHRGVVFPRSVGESRVEPHTDLLLKAIVSSGVAPDRAVVVEGQSITVADHYRSSLRRAWMADGGTSFDDYNDAAWALRGLAAWAPPGLSWDAEGGHPMTMDGFTVAMVDEQHRLNAELRASLVSGVAVQKKGQGIWTHTCGGAHTLQATGYAVARGFGGQGSRDKVLADVPVLFHRLELELSQVDRALAMRPEYGLLLIEQRLKFLGHFLETVHTLAALGLVDNSPANQAAVAKARAELVQTVKGLEGAKVFERLGELKGPQLQLYLDYVGDASHAVHALDLSTGDATVSW